MAGMRDLNAQAPVDPASRTMPRTLRPRGFALILWALHGLAGCAGMGAAWQAPEVELVGIQPRQIALERQSVVLRLRLTNPNDRALPVKGLTYRVLLEGRELAEGSSELARLIPPGGREEVELEVRSDLLALLPDLPRLLLTEDALDWTVSGTALAQVGGVRVPLPYRYGGRIEPGALSGRAPRSVP